MLTKSQCDKVRTAYESAGYAEAGRVVMEILDSKSNFRDLLVTIDSELSAIAHGRPPSEKRELIQMYSDLRSAYGGK